MATIPFALSVHHFISSVGADVGFASIIGLAILVLLYFAQARETANLREQAYESAQRVAQLEARMSSMAHQQPTVAPQPAVAARPAAVAGARVAASVPALVGAVAAAPGPPAGVAAPALSAATRLIPTTPIGPEPVADELAHQPRPIDLTSLSGPAPATAAAGAAAATTAAGPTPATAAGTAPATSAVGGNGVGNAGVATAPPRITPQPPPRTGLRPSGRGARPAEGGRRQATPPPRRSGPPPRSRRGVRLALLLVGALLVAGAVLALIHFTSSGSNPASTKGSATSNAPATAHRKAAGAVIPSSVTVAVLNGTATAGLAERIATELSSGGYKKGMVGNASDQTRTATVVAYTPHHKKAALAVAKILKLGPASVQPIDSNTLAVACPGGATCADKVVVTVGSDLAA
jgi:LytR cell envelope-related transcriptional attenuator